MTGLAVVDISGLASEQLRSRRAVARELDRACAESGFLYITGVQLQAELFQRLHARARAYFALDHATKMKSYIGLSENHSGYVPVGEEELSGNASDLKEAYDINCDYLHEKDRRPLLGPNIWPEMVGFREDVTAYYRHMSDIGRQIFRAFALALGLEEDHFDPLRRHPPSQLRMIHYPPDTSAQDRPGIGAHTDYECFTLLFATAAGLQILDKKSRWVDVPLLEGAMIMNIGDMMEILSNGRYLATRHRVKNLQEERYSFPMFHACDYDHVIAPVVRGEVPRYAPIKSGEHLFNQTAQTFAYLRQRIARGELALTEALPPGSFGPQIASSGKGA